jgi:putative oxygen-independent coproporphyrinogen III oxidase
MTPFGAYVHIPFCAHRCDYCAFATWTDRGHLVSRYLAALGREIDAANAEGFPALTSVFFGGGTPSLVPAEALMDVLERLPLARGAEVTVECNPDTLTAALLATYVERGVTRVSLGVQSMVGHVLGALGRTHNPQNVERSVALVRASGLPTFNLDVIYGAAGETLDDWRATLEQCLAFDPPHVSAYGLTVEAGTPLADDPSRYPDDDDQADKYLLADALLREAGLVNYEISNWARPGAECRHNLLYWEQGEYIGFGCAAHSHRNGARWWNVRTIERYVALIEKGRSAEGGRENLDAAGRRLEGLQLALRTRDGVPARTLPVDELPGLVHVDDGQARLTVSGRLLANEVSLRLR